MIAGATGVSGGRLPTPPYPQTRRFVQVRGSHSADESRTGLSR